MEIPHYQVNVEPKPEDKRDFKLEGLAAATEPPLIDWNAGSGLVEPKDEDQGSSGSCTEQGFCYYFWQKTGIDLSRHDGYFRIAKPGGGAWPHEPYWLMDKQGQFDRTDIADPNPQTEQNMTEVVIVPGKERPRKFVVKYWGVVHDMDAIAYAIKKFGGVTGCIYGSWDGWLPDMSHPRPPKYGEDQQPWPGGHMLYFYDFLLEGGEKTLKGKSSWCNYVKNHFIKSNYLPFSYNWYAMEVKEAIMQEERFIVDYKGKLGVAFLEGFMGNILFASNLEHLIKICETYQVEFIAGPNGYPTNVHKIN